MKQPQKYRKLWLLIPHLLSSKFPSTDQIQLNYREPFTETHMPTHAQSQDESIPDQMASLRGGEGQANREDFPGECEGLSSGASFPDMWSNIAVLVSPRYCQCLKFTTAHSAYHYLPPPTQLGCKPSVPNYSCFFFNEWMHTFVFADPPRPSPPPPPLLGFSLEFSL